MRTSNRHATKTTLSDTPGQAAPVPEWRLTGAEVQGVSHARLGLPCQDVQAYRVEPDGTLLVALADGAGSAEFSELGARCAVESALLVLTLAGERGFPAEGPGRQAGWESLFQEIFLAARGAVLRLVEDEEGAPVVNARRYACTLTCAVAGADYLAVGQIGDGVVVASGGRTRATEPDAGEEADRFEDHLFTVTRLQRGEYANETHFITQEDALDQLSTVLVECRIDGLAVMSDGLLRLALKMSTQEPHRPFFEPLFRFAGAIHGAEEAAAQLASFLGSERVNARTDDDKSLVLAVRAPGFWAEEQSSLDREGK